MRKRARCEYAVLDRKGSIMGCMKGVWWKGRGYKKDEGRPKHG